MAATRAGYWFLINRGISMAIRAQFVRSVLMSIGSYGWKLFGMNKERCRPIQMALDVSIRSELCASRYISMTRPQKKMRMTTVYYKACLARWRAHQKWKNSITWISNLIEITTHTQKQTWLAEIKNKPSWNKKIKNTEIREKWIKEFQPHFEEQVINYAIDEALYYSDIFTGSLVPGAVDCTYIVDDCVPEELLNDICITIRSTEDVSSTGVPKWDSIIGKGETKFVIPTKENNKYLSKKYQWLPTEFDINANGFVDILSYIYNLHPEIHEKMYETLERIFEKFVPLFNNVLTDSCKQNNKNDKTRI
ncbi:hypothetical protein BB558_007001, partial [Smittium angustum]